MPEPVENPAAEPAPEIKDTVADKVDQPVLVSTTTLSKSQSETLKKLIDELPRILEETGDSSYDEIYGYRINESGLEHVHDEIRNEIVLKFLIAEEYKFEEARTRLINTFKWRKKFQPLSAAYSERFDKELDDLGVITKYDGTDDNLHVVTWNLYGNLKSPKKLFERFGQDEKTEKEGSPFLRWRIGLMERALSLLDFTDKSNSKIAQVHDYNNVSMLRMDPGMKAATKEIIKIFGDNYPELLSTKFFVNVPTIMSWVFSFFRTIGLVSEDTWKKFQVLNSGNLAAWFGEKNLPKAYNGSKDSKVESLFASAASTGAPEYAKIMIQKAALDID
ncbi:Phosphatidylinositol transfer protein SFH5 [Meyerozyma sp. JA9]|nr:Phosphatidylinositol transfer protein SFH5 [Meyerozyma sp. JA9]